MSESIDDGGRAFPQPIPHAPLSPDQFPQGGMTMRDYFAARATEDDLAKFIPRTVGDCLQFAVIARWIKPNCTNPPASMWNEVLSIRLRYWAKYQHADYMIAARREKL